MTNPKKQNPGRGKVIQKNGQEKNEEIKATVKGLSVKLMGEVDITSKSRIHYTREINKYYLVKLLPIVLEREVEFQGRSRQELYIVGEITEFESVSDATKAYAIEEVGDRLMEIDTLEDREPLAIKVPKSLFKQIVTKVKEEDVSILEGKGYIIALIHVGDSGRVFKRGGKEYPVRQYSVLELKTKKSQKLMMEDGSEVSIMALSYVQTAIDELKGILGIGGGDDENKE